MKVEIENPSHIKARINQTFNEQAVSFIAEIFTIEGKSIPQFNNNDEVLELYFETQKRIKNDLMWHRNKPIESDRLSKLRGVNSLPKPIKIILQSLA